MSAERLQDAIRKRAEQIYMRSGTIPGRDLENWVQAESEIMRERESAPRRTAVVVEVHGVQYVGEYDPNACDGYLPGEFQSGEELAIRFDGEKNVGGASERKRTRNHHRCQGWITFAPPPSAIRASTTRALI